MVQTDASRQREHDTLMTVARLLNRKPSDTAISICDVRLAVTKLSYTASAAELGQRAARALLPECLGVIEARVRLPRLIQQSRDLRLLIADDQSSGKGAVAFLFL